MKLSHGITVSIGILWLLAIMTISGFEISLGGYQAQPMHTLAHTQR